MRRRLARRRDAEATHHLGVCDTLVLSSCPDCWARSSWPCSLGVVGAGGARLYSFPYCSPPTYGEPMRPPRFSMALHAVDFTTPDGVARSVLVRDVLGLGAVRCPACDAVARHVPHR